MKKVIFLVFTIFSLKVSAQKVTEKMNCICNTLENKAETISLQKFIEKINTENNSLKIVDVNPESVNVVVDDLFIEKFSEYKIEESCVDQVKVLITDPKGINRDGNIPTIIIITNRKK